jgi:hypothetical protein
MRLLLSKRCAIAPGVAFSTADNPQDLARHLPMLDSFCRVCVANSDENVLAGVHLICDLMDEIDMEKEKEAQALQKR